MRWVFECRTVILVLLLTAPLLFYVLLCPRDAIDEFRAVFDPNVIRRSLRIKMRRSQFQFSLIGLMLITTSLGVFIAAMRGLELPVETWPIAAVLCLLLYMIARYVSYDLSLRSPRRKHRRHFQTRSTRTGEHAATKIRFEGKHLIQLNTDPIDIRVHKNARQKSANA